MNTPTPRQQAILDWIRTYLATEGVPPSRADIALAFGFRSPNAAEQHLQALANKGYLDLTPGRRRNIRLRPAAGDPTALPVVGRVAAGAPLLAEAQIEALYALDPALFTPRADYLLRVRGLSMRDAGILDGDLVAVHRTAEARSGELIVARLHDEVTVKRLEWTSQQLRLLSANPDFAPRAIDPDRDGFVIEGLVVGLIRHGRL